MFWLVGTDGSEGKRLLFYDNLYDKLQSEESI